MKNLDIIPPPPHKLIDNDEWVIDNRNTYTKYHVNKSIIKNRDESYQFLITSQYSRKGFGNGFHLKTIIHYKLPIIHYLGGTQ